MSFGKWLHHRFRVLLKHTLNPLTRRMARSGRGPFSLVRHVGRRSGRVYETPLILGRSGEDFVAELTYGPNVDWYQNVLASGGCTLIWRGREHAVRHIEPVDAATGRNAFPRPARLILRAARRRRFVRMRADPPPERS